MRPNPRPCVTFRNKLFVYGEELLAPAKLTSWKITSCRLFAIAHSLYSQLSSVPLWQVPT